VRLLTLAAAVVGALVVLVMGRGVALPWEPGCSISDPTGQVLAEGSPSEISVLISTAEGDIAQALGSGPGLTCRTGSIGSTNTPKEPPLGLTPRAAALRAEVRAQFGDVPDGGFGPEEVLPGRSAEGEHSLGRAVDFFFRPHEDADQARAGWQLANWSVANAERLGIRTVIYRDQIWTARRSVQGWREYRFSGPDSGNPVNRHLDHVHVDVA
jgi:hypothetical protein